VGEREYDMLRGRMKREYATLTSTDTREQYRGMEVVGVVKKSYVGFGV
jgi:hypothetical protein